MDIEKWKDIKGYEGHYQISNLGRVKSLYFKNYHGIKKREKILKPSKNTHGYLFVALSDNSTYKRKTIHRLVAENFIDNPNNLEQVNHIDGNKLNNNINNLEWCTQKYNINEAWRLGLAKQYKGKKHPESRAVNQYSLDGQFIRKWDCIMDIEREKGYLNVSICKCCRDKQKTAYGYRWRYA